MNRPENAPTQNSWRRHLRDALTTLALASSRRLKSSNDERQLLLERAARLERLMADTGLPVTKSLSYIAPSFVSNVAMCKSMSYMLLAERGIYVQLIDYPTVPRDSERLRFAPSPVHSDAMMIHLIAAPTIVWDAHRLACAA